MKYSVRDKVPVHFNLRFRRTGELINLIETGKYPDVSIIQCHTLWTDNLAEWFWLEIREYLRSRLKIFSLRFPLLRKLFYMATKLRSR